MDSTVTASVPKKRKRFSPMLHYWKCGVKSNMRMSVIITFLHLAASPPVLLSVIFGIYASSYDALFIAEAFLHLGKITTAIAAFMGMFIAVNSFNCLHKRDVVDMKFSLPLSSSQRFIGDFFSGLFSYLAPFLSVQMISVILISYGLAFMDGKNFVFIINNNSEPFVCDYFAKMMIPLLKFILCGTLIMLMFYTITVFVTVCCGSKAESIFYSLLVNFVLPAVVFLVFYIAFCDLYGVYDDDLFWDLIIVTSVGGGIEYFLDWFTGYSIYCHPSLWVTLYFIVTVLYWITAFLLYRKRRAEQVSKPFAFKPVYYIFVTAVVFGLYSLFYFEEISLIAMVIISAVVYMVLETAVNRGFRRFWLSIIKYAAVLGGSALMVLVIRKSDGFGIVQIVPPAWAVSSVEMDYNGYYNDFVGYHLGFNEPENIRIITDAHKAVLRNYNQHKNDYYDSEYWFSMKTETNTSIYIYYRLKGGLTLERKYPFTNWEASEILSQIDLTDEYKVQTAGYYEEMLLSRPEKMENTLDSFTSQEDRDKYIQRCRVYVGLNGVIEKRDTVNEDGISEITLCRNGFYEQLAVAYSKDIMNITEENYYRSALKDQYCLWNGNHNFLIDIPGSFTNTIELLERSGFVLPRTEDITDEEIYEYILNLTPYKSERVYSAENGIAAIYSESKWQSVRNIPEDAAVLRSRYGYYNGDNDYRVNNIYLSAIDSRVCDLFRSAEPRNIVCDGGYVVRLDGFTGAVPAELVPEAERIATENILEDTSTEYNYTYIRSLDMLY